MFSIFTNDNGKEVNSEGTNFVEDIKLFKIVKSEAAMQKFTVLNDQVKIR